MSTKNNISNFEDEDLKGLAPQLSKLSRKNPFKADDDYFERLASKLENSIIDFEELKTEAPVLSNIPRYATFEVQPNYFDDFPTRIQEIVNVKSSKISFVEWVILLIKPNFALPVLITLLIAFIGINYIEKHGEISKTASTYTVSEEEQLYLIDESTLIEELLSISESENEKIVERTTGIENYLIENNIDETNMNNEL